MKSKFSIGSVLFRLAWIAMAIMLFVICGPVRKYIELKISNDDIKYSSQTFDKKPRMGLRICRAEKLNTELSQSLSSPPVINILSAFLFYDFTIERSYGFISNYTSVHGVSGSSRYLSLRKLQV